MLKNEHIEYIKQLGLIFDFDNLTAVDYHEIAEIVKDRLIYCGFDDDHALTPEGAMCDSILDAISV